MTDIRSAADGLGEAPARRARRGVVLVTMCVGLFLVQLDVTIVNVALPHIGQELHTGVAGLQWVVDGYALLLASLLLTGGTLGDLYGHKRLVLTGLAVFGVASAGAGLAGGVEVLVAFRALQGVGAAVLLPCTLAVITHLFPERSEKARAIGIWAAVSGLALPAGPLPGVLLAALLSASAGRAGIATTSWRHRRWPRPSKRWPGSPHRSPYDRCARIPEPALSGSRAVATTISPATSAWP